MNNMAVTISLPHVFRSASNASEKDASDLENAYVLRALLDCLINIDLTYLKLHPRTKRLYDSGVRYGRTQVWDSIPALYEKKMGDCKSLTAALIAERRFRGEKASPNIRFTERKSDGKLLYHILVQTPDGFEDPSKVCGMSKNENAYFQQLPGWVKHT